MFNALTKNQVLAANYAYATIEPNIGAVPVPDARLGRLAEIFTSARIVPATVTFVDIAGLAKGASTGQGLGNRFLANIRETDAICQVIRVFTDPDVDGAVAPADDIETVNTELILADLQTIDRALPRLQKGQAGEGRTRWRRCRRSRPRTSRFRRHHRRLEPRCGTAVRPAPADGQAGSVRVQPRRRGAGQRRAAS